MSSAQGLKSITSEYNNKSSKAASSLLKYIPLGSIQDSKPFDSNIENIDIN